MMNWITTNIRLPEESYMELKVLAARKRTSISAIIRERIGIKPVKADRKEFWKRLDRIYKKNIRNNPGLSLSEKLIEMRYEQ